MPIWSSRKGPPNQTMVAAYATTLSIPARIGMDCHILLEDRTGSNDPNYNGNGNVLLDHLHGATTEKRSGGADMVAEMDAVADRMRAAGRKVFVIPGGGSNPTGALGYVNCAYELVGQANDRGLVIDHIVTATGSAGTQAGLIVGLKAMSADIPLLGMGVRAPKDRQEANVFALAERTAEKLGCPGVVSAKDVVADCGYVAAGYGKPGSDTLEAISMFARLEGILLDPVYSGKAAAGLIDYCRKGRFRKGERVVFVHTGGSAALFGYDSAISATSTSGA